jgi:hypothetical protein
MKRQRERAEEVGRMRISMGAVVVAAVSSVALWPSASHACEPVTLCAEWEIDLEDGGWGDHVTGSTVPARGARMTLIRPSPEPPLGVFLDNEGCITFETQYAVGHKAVLYNEAVYDELVHVRVFSTESDQLAGVVHEWGVDIPAIGDGDDVFITIPVSSGGSDGAISSTLGVATETLYRLDALPPGLPQQSRTLDIFYDHESRNAWGSQTRIKLGRDSNSEKFVFAHEVGHWLEQGFTGQGFFPEYGYDITDPECDFSIDDEVTEPGEMMPLGAGLSNLHGIRSAEHGHAAMTEAYAHFVAAAAYSGDTYNEGVFRYYKDIDVEEHPSYQDLVDNENLVVLAHTSNLGGQVRWTQSMCGANDGDSGDDWDPPLSEGKDISTELDWLRFFWGFYRSPQGAGAEPSFWNILELVSFSHNNDFWPDNEDGYDPSNPRAWDQLVGAVNNPASGLTSFASRFTGLESTYEVIND